MMLDLNISNITWIGLIIAVFGVVFYLASDLSYSINGIQIFPFLIIPVGILISLLGFMIKK
jgi:hypothetical protein